MYEPAKVDVFADQGGSVPNLGIGALQPAGPSDSGGLGPMDLLRLGRTAYNLVGPDIGLPSMSDIGSSLGLEGIFGGGAGGGALGGLMTAGMYAAPAMALAMLFSKISNTGDTAVSYGGGIGSLRDGYQHTAGRSAQNLYDQWAGDRGWYSGGDPSGVDLPMDFGSMSMRKERPYFNIGGVPYQTPDLAVHSGRSIARGMMGLPVDYGDLPNAYMGNGAGISGLVERMNGKSFEPYDAPQALPGEWDQMIALRNNLGTGEGQNSSDVRLDAFMAGLDPRTRQHFDQGLTTDQMWAFTGPQMADLPLYSGELDTARNDTVKRLGDAVGISNAQPFDPLTYGYGAGRDFFPDRRQPGKYPG